MHDLTPRIVAIVEKYVRDAAARITAETALADLGIDVLDRPMIALDIEDAFDVALSHEDEQAFATVGTLVDRTATLIADQASRPRRLTTVPRSRSSWMSTGA